VRNDPKFSSHAAAELSPDIRSFIGVPVILSDGTFYGTLCAVDPEPQTLTRQQADLLAVLARLVATQIERQRVEEELRLRDRAIAASNNGILITDPDLPDNPLIYVNESFLRTTGYGADEVLGRNCRFLQGQDRDQPELDKLREAVLESRECRVVLRNYKKDGTLFWNELGISPVYDETGRVTNHIGVQNDITERKRAEQALRESETALNTILNNLEEGILVTDSRARVSFANPAARAILSIMNEGSLQELPNPWEDFHLSKAVSQCARDGEGIEARVSCGEGHLRVRLEPLAKEDERDDVLVVIQDLSEGDRLEANQQRFLANAAHQLRTPLMAIMGAAELLATGEDANPATRGRLLNHISSESRRMQRLSDALLRLSRVGWDLREPKFEVVDMKAAGQRAGEAMEPLLESAGLRLSIEGEGTSWVRADPDWLQEVLLVLLSNAIKHSTRGGDIRLRAGVGTIVLEDEGVGINPADLPHIFERFYRGTGPSEGFGLGLSICRELIERMGGNISIRSREGVGTAVQIELPEVDAENKILSSEGDVDYSEA
jgi:PAS domain S-box-containing protein